VKRSTVYLRVDLPNGGVSQGTGFFALDPGIVMTNAHVIGMLGGASQPPRSVTVVANSGEPDEFSMPGSVIGVDRNNDLAVVRVQPNPRMPPPLPVDSANKLIETQKVYVFGFPLGVQLGKNITVTDTTITSLRREGGRLTKIQVNGGMHPGNSGGPVTDSRGVVVGVSVAIIKDTTISFAIPGDFVRQILDGRVNRSELGTPYLNGGETRLPVRLTALDPLSRLRDVKVEVWTGNPGNERPPATEVPPTQIGDGSSRAHSAARRDNNAYTADVPLPSLEPGKVYWVRPTFVNGHGELQWGPAMPVPFEAQAVVDRKPALLQFKAPSSPIERTLKMNYNQTVTLHGSLGKPGEFKTKMESNLLESLSRDPRGIGTFVRLTQGKTEFVRQTPDDQIGTPPPQAIDWLSKYSATFMVNDNHMCRERGKRTFNGLPASVRQTVESLFETVCNTFEATTLPLPNKMLEPMQTWEARLPTFVLIQNRRQQQNLHLTCTYEGLRSANGRQEAFINLSGVVRGTRTKAKEVLGKVKGHAAFDVEGGYLTLVKVTVENEVELETPDASLRVLVSEESILTRIEGNHLGITAATSNQPGPSNIIPRGPQTGPKGPINPKMPTRPTRPIRPKRP
jgi:hypothetical protein